MVDMAFTCKENNLSDLISGNNMTSENAFDDESMKQMPALHMFRNIGIPVISAIGILGNALSLVVFSARSMKNASCTVFLAALAFVDNLFLVCLLVTWIDEEYFPLMRHDFCCQLLIFFSYVSSFLSVWFIASFSLERFIAICFPLRVGYMCSIYREKVTVLLLCIIACALYNFSFWTISLQPVGQRMRCYHKMEFFNFLEIATWTDSALTMVIPFFLITVINTIVLRTVRKCSKMTNVQRTYIHDSKSVSLRDNVLNSLLPSSTKIKLKEVIRLQTTRASPHIRVTRTLLLVSTTFLCLNLPSHAMRLYNLFLSFTSTQQSEISIVYTIAQEMTLMLYYATFSCNFFLYTAFGRNFQNSLKQIIHCRSSTNYYRDKMLQRFSSTRGGSNLTSL